MASFAAPKHDFDPADLAVLDQAFEATWITIQAHHPFSSAAKEEEHRVNLRRLLFALACQGVSDVHTLRNLALASIPLLNDDNPAVRMAERVHVSPEVSECLPINGSRN